MTRSEQWLIYRGTGEPHNGIATLPDPPPWRTFQGVVPEESMSWEPEPVSPRPDTVDRARVYLPDSDVVEMVNAALYLRRPLLVTGKPGTGKSTLAYSVAFELQLGPVLRWPVTSRSTLSEALFLYDAVGRLQEASLHRDQAPPDVGRYVRLGPLGTALLPRNRPRVLLIDELDKSDIDMPNDLLNVFEEGQFDIPQLSRLPEDQSTVDVMTADPGRHTMITNGQVRCRAFPFVVITSNGEREFPAPFLRRCIRLYIQQPDTEKLSSIVAGHLGAAALDEGRELIDRFVAGRERGDLATDQLLNAIFLAASGTRPAAATRERLVARLLRPLDSSPGS